MIYEKLVCKLKYPNNRVFKYSIKKKTKQKKNLFFPAQHQMRTMQEFFIFFYFGHLQYLTILSHPLPFYW